MIVILFVATSHYILSHCNSPCLTLNLLTQVHLYLCSLSFVPSSHPCVLTLESVASNVTMPASGCHSQSRSRGTVGRGQIESSCIGSFPLTRSQPHLQIQEEQVGKMNGGGVSLQQGQHESTERKE